jgi:hypothetical protein
MLTPVDACPAGRGLASVPDGANGIAEPATRANWPTRWRHWHARPGSGVAGGLMSGLPGGARMLWAEALRSRDAAMLVKYGYLYTNGTQWSYGPILESPLVGAGKILALHLPRVYDQG